MNVGNGSNRLIRLDFIDQIESAIIHLKALYLQHLKRI